MALARAFVALVDVRPMLAGADRPMVETSMLAVDQWVDIPVGVVHGFLALEELDIIYLVTNRYDGSDELGLEWDDPLVAIVWPSVPGSAERRPILSPRDRENPPLEALVNRLRDRE